jgi:ribonucleoside-diphosphate reductase alpha subunit
MNPAPKLAVSPIRMAQHLISQLMDGIKTSQLDELGAEAAYALYTTHPDYGQLAARITVSAMHKDHRALFAATTEEEKRAKKKRGTFAATIERIQHEGLKTGRGVYRAEFMANVRKHGAAYEAMIDHDADYNFTYFALRTLKNGYLTTRGGVRELPQHLWMRIAVGFHGGNLDRVRETYVLLRDLKHIYGTPTLFNMGLELQQLSSCYLTGIHQDSIKGIYRTLARCADISKTAGGIGMHIHNIRNAGSEIRGTGGTSSGIVPMLRQFNETARYVDQGGGKRPGSIAVYAEPHMQQMRAFLDLRKNHGDENLRARDLFSGLWISDLFMKRVEADAQWSLFCPSKAKGLSDVWGDEYEALYTQYEKEGVASEMVSARELWLAIVTSHIETGSPYMLYKDACNAKSNQKNLGTIKCSNLCTEIIEFTSKDETAVCNLSSICLPRYVKPGSPSADGAEGPSKPPVFDFDEFHAVAKVVTRNLNIVIDINAYPVLSAARSNRRHRPVGIGVQGLDDLFKAFGYPFDSEEAMMQDTEVFETLYHAAVEASVELAVERRGPMCELRRAFDDGEWEFGELEMLEPDEPDDEPDTDPDYRYRYVVPGSRFERLSAGRRVYLTDLLDRLRPIPEEMKLPEQWAGAYSSFAGSPASQGELQFHMWDGYHHSGRWDWEGLKQKVVESGMRNSLLVAPMPTASTSQIEGNNEAFEPRTSNMYSRRTGAGEFVVMNEVLVRDLLARGKWTEDVKNSIIRNNGSVQQLDDEVLDAKGKALHKTAWELSMRSVIDHAARRGRYIDQSMSMNLWVERPTFASLYNMHFYAWKAGLKTGMYYLRTRALASPQQVTLPVQGEGGATVVKSKTAEAITCSLKNRGECEACSA